MNKDIQNLFKDKEQILATPDTRVQYENLKKEAEAYLSRFDDWSRSHLADDFISKLDTEINNLREALSRLAESPLLCPPEMETNATTIFTPLATSLLGNNHNGAHEDNFCITGTQTTGSENQTGPCAAGRELLVQETATLTVDPEGLASVLRERYLENRNTAFKTIVVASKTTAVRLDAPLLVLNGHSIITHLQDKFRNEVAAVKGAIACSATEPDLYAAQTALEERLADYCRGLCFRNPTDIALERDPVFEALMSVCVPKSDKPIPSFNSISELLPAAGFVVRDGAISCRRPDTGSSITIKPCTPHRLDATVLIVDSTRTVLYSGRVWNHKLLELVTSFMVNRGSAVPESKIDQWEVPVDLGKTSKLAENEDKRANLENELCERLDRLRLNETLEINLNRGNRFTITVKPGSPDEVFLLKKSGTFDTATRFNEVTDLLNTILGTNNENLEALYTALDKPTPRECVKVSRLIRGCLASVGFSFHRAAITDWDYIFSHVRWNNRHVANLTINEESMRWSVETPSGSSNKNLSTIDAIKYIMKLRDKLTNRANHKRRIESK